VSYYSNDIKDNLIKCWNDEAFKEAYKEKSNLQIFDGSDYFLGKLSELKKDYSPTLTDLIYTRRKTIGINDIKFEKKGITFKLLDVGGQKNERKKWDQIAEETDMIFHLSSLNDYHKKMYEDNKTNRLIDNLNTFKSTIDSSLFKSCKVVLIFSKYDLFVQDLKNYPFKDYFDDFKGFFYFV
jgi:hypothetical protein